MKHYAHFLFLCLFFRWFFLRILPWHHLFIKKSWIIFLGLFPRIQQANSTFLFQPVGMAAEKEVNKAMRPDVLRPGQLGWWEKKVSKDDTYQMETYQW